MISYKKYILTFGVTVSSGLLATAIIIFIMDPFFHYHMPWFGMQPVVNQEAYQNPGLAAHASYDSIIIGNSQAENFDAAWFDEAYGIHTLKLTYSAATVENLRIAVECAQDSENEIRYVFGCIDIPLLAGKADEPVYPLPEYLYDDTLLNDVYYLLDKTTFEWIWDEWRSNQNNTVKPLSQAYMRFEEDTKFSKERVIQQLILPEKFIPIVQEKPAITHNTVMGVQMIKDFISKYPDTKYYFFYSPVSIAFWYKQYQDGIFLTNMEMLEYSMQELLKCENVELYFPSNYEIITDLDNYQDLIHFNQEIQYQIFEEIRDGKNRLTKENYHQYITQLKEMVLNFDFEGLFQSV